MATIPKIAFKIENIVASANLNVELDLYGIAREVENVEYEPEQFPGAILKLKEPKTSLLLFKNGKLICTGAKSEGEVERAINKAYILIKGCIRAKKKEKATKP
jgi:transcription initiation factor TFIID TATA-box-binding protein